MKFNFRFSNLLGTVYTKGNLEFTPEGDSILSPVGNRVTKFDLKNNKAETYPVETKYNITTVALSPDGWLMLLVDEQGNCLLCNTRSKSIVHRFNFARKVHAIKFSPDGKKFAVCKENKVLLYSTPGRSKQFNPFQLMRTFYGAYDETVCLDWSSDSQALISGSKDMSSRIHAADFFENLTCYVLGGHSESLVGCFFHMNSLNVYTVSRNGRLNVWECDTKLDGLIKSEKKPSGKDELIGGVGQDNDELSSSNFDSEANKMEVEKENEEETETVKFTIKYRKVSKHSLRDVLETNTPVGLLSCDYHKKTQILVSGFSNGAFLLHELSSFSLIHSLSISQQPITSCAFNKTGDWLALACEGLGQLLVWEWQSQTYVLKQQGHFNNMARLAYSPSGLYLASGGQDGKVKVWNTLNGQCFVTFNEHNAPVTGVTFKSNGQVICSSSLDGTVRAFDLNRYRNFRTFTTPQAVQFSCVSMDGSGELVAAGGFDVFDVYVWSMQTGHLLQTLSGHEGPISGICFNPSATRAVLASCSWDKTVRTWDAFDAKGGREAYTLSSDALAVCFRPDGKHIACSTLDAQIVIINVGEVDQLAVVKTIECKLDLGYSRKDTDKVTAKKLQFGKAFLSLSYTMDGEFLLAGGRSKYICIYNIEEEMLVKRFEISQNKSFDGIDEFLDRRKMTEFGNTDLIEEEADTEIDDRKIALPGVLRGDHSARSFKPEIQVPCVSFAPTARSWAACTTEGLLIFSLDAVSGVFDPFDLDIDITPRSVRASLAASDHPTALMQALRLNEPALISLVVERVPVNTIDVLVSNLPDVYVDKLLAFVADQLDKSAHVQFYLIWVQEIFYRHGVRLKMRSNDKLAVLCTLEKALVKKFDDLNKICDSNNYSIDYILNLNGLKKQRPKKKSEKQKVEDENENESEDQDDDDISITMNQIHF